MIPADIPARTLVIVSPETVAVHKTFGAEKMPVSD
jgi:hypothetical protein